jgi:alpha-amylase
MKEYNGAMMQYFHWYTPSDGSLWRTLAQEARALAKAGITSVWLPPAYKAAGGNKDVGYGVYDLFDLGEFDQKGSVRTKYGTRDEYLQAIKAVQAAGVQVYADVVFNHKMGADQEEEFKATPYNPRNRNEAIGDLQPIKAWTHFTFPGRGGKYSELQWHWRHFNAVDANSLAPDTQAVWLFEGKRFDDDVDKEMGNFDYLMGCDLDVGNSEVQEELKRWGQWYLDTTSVDGFRFDAVKHVRAGFFVEWLSHLRAYAGRDLFAVGEYWSSVDGALEHFIEATEGHIMLFDVGLHHSFVAAGRDGGQYDLRTLFDNSLVKHRPELAVTLVANHDTQPLQSLESVVEPWFKPLAYALILLRRDGYPCIFAPDYYGAEYTGLGKDGNEHKIVMPSHREAIELFLGARRSYAFGEQNDYFDDPHCVGWTRLGSAEHPGGLAVLLSNQADGAKAMRTAAPNVTYTDLTKQVPDPVVTNEEGWGEFRCKPGSVSVWTPAQKP